MTNKMPVVNRKYQIGDSFVSKYPNGFKDIHRIISLTECPYQPYIFKGDDSLYGYWQSEKYIDEHYDWRGFEELPEDNLQENEEMKINEGFKIKMSCANCSKEFKEIDREFQADCECYNQNGYVSSSSHVKEKEVSEVERALENIIDFLHYHKTSESLLEERKEKAEKLVKTLFMRAQNLVNALESERNRAPCETNKIAVSQVKNDEKQPIFAHPCESKTEPKIDMKEECVDPVNLRKETYRCAHDYVLKNQGYNNSDHLITEYECSICGENKMTIQS